MAGGRWGTFMSGVGAGLAGGANAYLSERDSQRKEKIAQQTNEIKLLLEQARGENRLSVAGLRTNAAQVLQQLKNAGNLDTQRLKNEGMAYVRELQNQGMLDQEDVRALSRMNLKMVDKEIAAGHDETAVKVGAGHDTASVKVGAGHDAASVQVGAGHDTASNYRADMGYSSATDVAGINQTGANDRAAAELPLKIFRANQGRYPRGNAAARRAGSISQPTFGPSYADSMNAGALNPIGPTPPQLPSANDMNMSPAPPKPSLFPSRQNIFQAPPPAAPPALDDAGAPMAAPPPAAAPPTLGSRGFIGYKGPERGGRSVMTEQRVEEQANDLMARITQLQADGKFDQARALKQQLADLVKQHQQ